MIKNAITYSVEMPSATAMVDFIVNNVDHSPIAKKPSPQQVSTIGFTKHPVTGEYVSQFDGGHCLTVLKWEKKINNKAVTARVADVVKSAEQRDSRMLTRKEVEAIKDQIIGELIPHTLPSPTYTFVYYHTNSQTLLVDTASNAVSDDCTSLLRKTIGSLKATTLYIDPRMGLTESVALCLEDGVKFLMCTPLPTDEPIVAIKILDQLELNGGDTKGVLKFKNVDLFDETSAAEIIGQIRDGGMHVKSIGLDYIMNAVSFQLTEGFKFKGFIFNAFEAVGEDSKTDWQAETLYATSIIVDIAKTLVDEFTVVEE